MKTEKNILIAFILNLCFSIFEFVGGIVTGSVAIMSDSIHDFSDAISIGISYFLERKSKKEPDETHTFGYARYSVIGGGISTLILICGSIAMIFNAIGRLIYRIPVNYNGMILLAIIGVIVNFSAAFFTQDGDSLNQKAVNLHLLEDSLGWIAVLVAAIVMRYTELWWIDPFMSFVIATLILITAIKNLKGIMKILLEMTPPTIDVSNITKQIQKITEVIDVHHIHIWSMDGQNNFATMHVVTNENSYKIKEHIRMKLYECGVQHVTLELERIGETCPDKICSLEFGGLSCSHCHHHK